MNGIGTSSAEADRLSPHRLAAAIGVASLSMVLTCLGLVVSNPALAATMHHSEGSLVAHALTSNPTCTTLMEAGGSDEVTGCVQASPTGLTFSWTGYNGFAFANQGIAYVGDGASNSEQFSCSIPTCIRFVPLASGEYSGVVTVVTGGSGPAPEMSFDLDVSASDPPTPKTITAPIVGMAASPGGLGYWEVGSDGNVYAFGDAANFGSVVGKSLNKPIVGMAATPDGGGYWLLGQDGGVFSFGDAQFYGSTGNLKLNKPVVGMAATPDGKGYWFVASDGGVFAYGDALFYGSTGSLTLNKPVVGMAVDQTTGGYWLVASDGGIFSFNAPFYGSTGNLKLNQPIVGMEAAADGSGYRFVANDGGVFDFNEIFAGSLGGQSLSAPIVGMTSFGTTGYWLVGASGNVTAFGGVANYGGGV